MTTPRGDEPEMMENVSMTIEHADPRTGNTATAEINTLELQKFANDLSEGLEAHRRSSMAQTAAQLRLGEKEDFPVPQDAEPYVDEHYNLMRERFLIALDAHEAADAEKKHATKVANIQKRRIAYLEVRMAEERARCLSIDKPDLHVLAIDRNDEPEAMTLDTWFLLSGRSRVEAVVYSVWLNGMETPYEYLPQPEEEA